MERKRLVIGVLFLVLAGLAGAVYVWQGTGRPNDEQTSLDQALPSNPELERQYERQLRAILEPFWQNSDPTGLKEKILELHAPGKYLELHLNVVLAFDLIERGQQDADQAAIEQGIEKLNRLPANYAWLK